MERLAGKVMLLWGVRRAALAIAAGAIGALALPPVGFFAALFISFTLLTWLMDGSTAGADGGFLRRFRTTFLLGWLFGFGYFVAGLWWLGNALLIESDEFAWALPLAIFGLPAFLALYYGLATAIAGILWSDGFGRLAALGLGFGIGEWLRSFVVTGFPWNAVAYGVMPMPLMMQSVGVVGIFGLSMLAVFVLAAPALIGTRKGMATGLCLAVLLFAAHLGYGAWRLHEADALLAARPAQDISVRLVQPVIDQARKMDAVDRAEIFEEHLALTAAPPSAGGKRPDVVVWPETAVPFLLTQNQDALARIADVLADGQVLIAGAVRSEDAGPGRAPRYYNSIYAIDSQGQIFAASDKVHLTPFGEYLPFEELFNAIGIGNIVDMPGGYSAGSRRSLITLPTGVSLYPLICYEAIFPDELDAGLDHASVLLNITNDAWFGVSPGPFQHFQQARVRAVETGLPLIRDANNGISAVVDPFGRILTGLNINQKGVIDSTLGGGPVPHWDNSRRQTHLWLIAVAMFLIAAISRLGFKSRVN